MAEFGLGRIQSIDERDRNYSIRTLMLPQVLPDYKYWPMFRPVLDQGREGTCVGYAWKHWMNCAPTISLKHKIDPSAVALYDQATNLDEWQGNENDRYFGTSVRAGAKALEERGHVRAYYWATTINEVVDYVRQQGPVVLGTDWYEDMFSPDNKGVVRATGRIVGGHAYLLNGVNVKTGVASLINSWGKEWGLKGRFKMSFETLDRLIASGEACTAMEQKV